MSIRHIVSIYYQFFKKKYVIILTLMDWILLELCKFEKEKIYILKERIKIMWLQNSGAW